MNLMTKCLCRHQQIGSWELVQDSGVSQRRR